MSIILSNFINSANIGAADYPHTVVEKLQAAIDRATPSAPSTACEVDELHEAGTALLQYLDDHGWGGIVEGETANRFRAALASKPAAREVDDLLRKLVEHYPNRVREMYCDGEPVGRKLVAHIATTQTTEAQHERK